MDFTPLERHKKVAERNVRTVKEHVYANILHLGPRTRGGRRYTRRNRTRHRHPT